LAWTTTGALVIDGIVNEERAAHAPVSAARRTLHVRNQPGPASLSVIHMRHSRTWVLTILEAEMNRIAAVLAAAFFLAGCNSDTPLPTDDHMSHAGGIMLADAAQSTSAQTLSALREFSAPLHDLAAADHAGYALFSVPGLTSPDGCISDARLGGMGYHYTRGNNLADDAVALLDPEFLVYAPTNAPAKGGVQPRRLAALEYFLPFTPKWPAPADPAFARAPTLHDFSTMQGLPDAPFVATSRFGGWMFHIWLWENNPAGMFTNWNTSVSLCAASPV